MSLQYVFLPSFRNRSLLQPRGVLYGFGQWFDFSACVKLSTPETVVSLMLGVSAPTASTSG
jgi:hypothetical protein